MKNIKYLILFAMLSSIVTGCKEDRPEIGEAFNKAEALDGTWALAVANQVDEKSPTKEARPITPFYRTENDSLSITFDFATKTYEVNVPAGKNFFGDGGSWSLDDEFVPRSIFLTSEGQTIELEMRNVVRSWENELTIAYARFCDGEDKAYTSYEFNLIRQ